jgi:uncharacterized protein YbaR (Trm112 family)
MFFCKKCNNAYDITDKIPTIVSETDSSTEPLNENLENAKIIDLINKLLNEEIQKNEFNNINIDILLNSTPFKKLNIKKRDKIKQILKPLIDDIQYKATAYFICKNCGNNEPIKEGTLLYQKISKKEENNDYQHYGDLIYDQTLPITRNFTCPNEKCLTHTDKLLKEAVFFREHNSYKIIYICRNCKTSW